MKINYTLQLIVMCFFFLNIEYNFSSIQNVEALNLHDLCNKKKIVITLKHAQMFLFFFNTNESTRHTPEAFN